MLRIGLLFARRAFVRVRLSCVGMESETWGLLMEAAKRDTISDNVPRFLEKVSDPFYYPFYFWCRAFIALRTCLRSNGGKIKAGLNEGKSYPILPL